MEITIKVSRNEAISIRNALRAFNADIFGGNAETHLAQLAARIDALVPSDEEADAAVEAEEEAGL